MVNVWRGIWLVSILLAVSACGYHLQGTHELPAQIDEIAVQFSGNRDTAFESKLLSKIATQGVNVTADAKVLVELALENVEKELITVAEDGGPSLTRYSRSALVSVSSTAEPAKKPSRIRASASEDVVLSPNQVLSDQLEKAEYQAVIDRALIDKILTILAYQLR